MFRRTRSRVRSPGRARNTIFFNIKNRRVFYGFCRRPLDVDGRGRFPDVHQTRNAEYRLVNSYYATDLQYEMIKTKINEREITCFRRNIRFEIEFYHLTSSNSNGRRRHVQSSYGRPRGLGSVRLRL